MNALFAFSYKKYRSPVGKTGQNRTDSGALRPAKSRSLDPHYAAISTRLRLPTPRPPRPRATGAPFNRLCRRSYRRRSIALNGICCAAWACIRGEIKVFMKIAQIAPLIESVPPRLYGGTERIVSYLTEELVRLGHDVTLFASEDSITSAELAPCCTRALRLDPTVRDIIPYFMLMIDKVRERAEEFDVLHFHID